MCPAGLSPKTLLVLAATSAFWGTACDSARSGSSRVNPTYIEVNPASFRGDAVCGEGAGGLRWYVATLIDVTEDKFRLPSSPPTRCTQSVFFSGVVPRGSTLGFPHEAHEYVAELEGYASETLRPEHEGSNVMLSEGRTVTPGWLGSCGMKESGLGPLLGLDAGADSTTETGFRAQLEGPLTPYPGRSVSFPSCRFESLVAAATTGSVTVSLSAALGDLECGPGTGQIERFEATLGDRVESARCEGSVTFDDLDPGFVELGIVAFEGADADAAATDGGVTGSSWTTTCYQDVVASQRLTARCDSLVQDQ